MLSIIQNVVNGLMGNAGVSGIVASVLGLLVGFNTIMSVLSSGLAKLQQIIPNNPTEQKVASVINSILGILKKIIDFISANVQH